MPRDPRTYLWEARSAAALVAKFVEGRSLDDYTSDVYLRSAVERQLAIVGEALNQLSQVDPELAGRIDDLPRIVAFRNILVHGYAAVDNRLVWAIATERVEPLIDQLDTLVGTDE